MIKATGLTLALIFVTFCDTAEAMRDNYKIVAVSRHTFRGINKTIGPDELLLQNYGIKQKTLPTLSWGEDATPLGLQIAQEKASLALQEATNKAIKALDKNKNFDGKWDEIRTDLATERTFWTAVRIREGLKSSAPVTGCAVEEGNPEDVIVARGPVMDCLKTDIKKILSSNPDIKLYMQRAEEFLKEVREALNVKDLMKPMPPVTFDDKGKPQKIYKELSDLASAIIMSAELGPPLQEIFQKANLDKGNRVLKAAANFLGTKFLVNNPGAVADVVSIYPLEYIEEAKPGSHTLLISHDESMSNLMRALDIINSNSKPDELAIYPLETFVFAFNDMDVSVVRMRIKSRAPDGYIDGSFDSKLIWKGTRAQWDQKVKQSKDRAESWKLNPEARTCLNDLSKDMCQPEPLDVKY